MKGQGGVWVMKGQGGVWVMKGEGGVWVVSEAHQLLLHQGRAMHQCITLTVHTTQ